jgi:hypothetical protein
MYGELGLVVPARSILTRAIAGTPKTRSGRPNLSRCSDGLICRWKSSAASSSWTDPRQLALSADPAALTEATPADVQVRRESAHDEAYVRLCMQDAVWPATLPAYDALERWAREHGREAAGVPRQLLIADQRTATADTLVMDLSVPLR